MLLKKFCSLVLGLTALSCSLRGQAQAPAFVKTADGVQVYPDASFSGSVRLLRLQVVRPHIIRVQAAPTRELPADTSLVVLPTAPSATPWTLGREKDTLVLKTSALTASVSLRTGAVVFSDRRGGRLLAENIQGRSFEPALFEGRQLWQVTRSFTTGAGDAWYGLGQHQDGLFNYAGRQVFLFQNNTEVAVPFLISRKNYGLLWDNYSLTRVGSEAPLRPLSALQLFDRDGRQGWLTASFANDKNKAEDILGEEPHSSINYEFLNDTKWRLPAAFRPDKGLVRWEGSLASERGGPYQLRFTYGGYLKLWVDGRLVLDRWRQPWNPGSALLDLPLEGGKKVPVKMEWIPNGGESYLSLKVQEPVPADGFGFSSEAGRQLDYYFIGGGSMDEVIAGYRTLTGRATLVPQWALGFWQSRERYKTAADLLGTVAEFRKRRVPLDNIVLDWSYWKQDDWGSQAFDSSRFPNADSMIRVLHNQYHTRFMISVWPKFYEGISAYNDFNRKGWLYTRNIADRQRDWIGKGYVSTFYDPFNAGARRGFWDLLHEKLFSKGVDAWWMDASEPDILSNVSPEKRKEQMVPLAAGPAAQYLNAYPLMNAKGIYEGQRSADANKRVFILTRSAFAGSQRYAAATWSGDIAARWEDFKAQIPAGLNFSLSGIPYWTSDIGGFAVEQRYEKAKAGADLDEWRELSTRWYQFGAFCPLFRVHGQFPFRELYHIAPDDHPAYQSMLYYNRLRYRLLPYIYSLAGKAYHDHYTLMRALVMDFAADTAVTGIGDQFLFGPSLLVSPVYTYKEREKELYLPSGQGWYDLYTGKYTPGGKRITAEAPYQRMPVYVKEGSILPLGPELQYTSEKTADSITLFVYTGKNASFTLYEDEGTNNNYEKGLHAQIPFHYNEQTKMLTIGDRKGQFPGMLQNRVFNVVWVSREKPVALDLERKPDATVRYSGRQVTVKQ
ncbi:TIM-barrel domain-containing protein [Paraflavisolibacter sp. H34]|uniref:TIM-barrel domain-containing protein n=1 Tax=Huijunlia imazamoxiresistens TaxID=3127457 RepID=UPI003015F756